MTKKRNLESRVVALEEQNKAAAKEHEMIWTQVSNHIPTSIREVRSEMRWMFGAVGIPTVAGIAVLIWQAVV